MWYFIIAFIFFWFGFLTCAVLAGPKDNFDPWDYTHPKTSVKEKPMDSDK